MQAVIIAAGKGSRMSHLYSPKPLTPIFGLRLIERIILVGKRAGVDDFKIVVGYEGTKIKKVIGSGKKYGVRIQYIDNPDWQKGNGMSVLKAKDSVQGKFLLLMSDHLCDEKILSKLLKADVEDGQCVLGVDKNLTGEHFDLNDVTRAFCQDGHVKYIDKSLEDFNAIDTGVFLCTPVIFDALEKSCGQGQYSLSAGNQILAREGRLKSLDATGCFWVDVDNGQVLKKAREMLIQQLFKPTDGPISKRLNRRVSTKISARLAKYHVSPNSITVASFGLAILSALFFFLGSYQYVVIAGVMAQLSSILDGCDGEIARLKFKFSAFGEWLDRILDRYSDGLIVLGMTYGVWSADASDYVWIAGFLALMGTYMNSYTAIVYDELLRNNLLPGPTLRMGRDVRLFIIFLGSLFNQLITTLFILGVITNVESIRRLFTLRNRYKFETAH